MPGLPSAVTYVRTLSSGNVETRGSGTVPRRRRPVTTNGVTPIHALPSNCSTSSPCGTRRATSSAPTGQCAKRSSSQVWPNTHGSSCSGHCLCAFSVSTDACRAGVVKNSEIRSVPGIPIGCPLGPTRKAAERRGGGRPRSRRRAPPRAASPARRARPRRARTPDAPSWPERTARARTRAAPAARPETRRPCRPSSPAARSLRARRARRRTGVPRPCRRAARSPGRGRGGSPSEVPAQRLLALDRLEEGLEVPLPERRGAVALDHLEEDRRPILGGLREDLEQVTVVVAVGEDPEAPQVGVVLGDLADAAADLLVIGVGRVEEGDAALLQRLDRADDVLALHGDVLDAGAAVEVEVLLDLALALALRRLVDRELELPRPVRHHLRHQRRILGLDLVVPEVDDVRHPEHTLIELDPVVHPAELDIADAMVDRDQADARARVPVARDGDVAGHVRALVAGPVDERVDRLAVGGDRRQLDRAVRILDPVRLGDAARPPLNLSAVCFGR